VEKKMKERRLQPRTLNWEDCGVCGGVKWELSIGDLSSQIPLFKTAVALLR
jgi:hypothetical protein